MPHDVSPERVLALSASARIALTPDDAGRIANTATALISCFADAKITLPLDTEPATFLAIQLSEQTGE